MTAELPDSRGAVVIQWAFGSVQLASITHVNAFVNVEPSVSTASYSSKLGKPHSRTGSHCSTLQWRNFYLQPSFFFDIVLITCNRDGMTPSVSLFGFLFTHATLVVFAGPLQTDASSVAVAT